VAERSFFDCSSLAADRLLWAAHQTELGVEQGLRLCCWVLKTGGGWRAQRHRVHLWACTGRSAQVHTGFDFFSHIISLVKS